MNEEEIEVINCPHCKSLIYVKEEQRKKSALLLLEVPRLGMVYINWFVSSVMGENPTEMRYSKCRKREKMICKQISQYICKKHNHTSYAIRDFFEYKQHGTVLSNIKTIQDLIDTEIKYKELVTYIENELNEKLI